MNDAAGILHMVLGWPIAPALMVMIALGWDAVTALGCPSEKRRRRSCITESQRMRELFGRYVGADVARRALENGTQMGGHERDVAVLFVDLVGSTALAADGRPGEVVGLLNEFFRIVVDVVDRHGGFVNKFQGDAALAVFGAPLNHCDGAGAALGAARELGDELVGALGCTGFGVGVSAGLAFAGDIGAEERLEYTVIGDPVNEAARLSELAKAEDGHVLASDVALRCALDLEPLSWDVGELVDLRGRAAPTRVARPVSLLTTSALTMTSLPALEAYRRHSSGGVGASAIPLSGGATSRTVT